MSMYFGSEFYEENHGEWLEQFIAKHGPKSLKMNRFEIEGRLGRLWRNLSLMISISIFGSLNLTMNGFVRLPKIPLQSKALCSKNWPTPPLSLSARRS